MSDRFRLGRMLGAGGMGTVHEAVDLKLDRPIAIKLLHARLAADPHQIARFEREARAAAKLAHPNVVGVTELVRDPHLGLGLVMELLAGESLASRLESGPLTESEAVNVFMQALDGLAAAHAAGMVHRDLKPSNVFLVPIAGGLLVKLLDFGIVKLAEEGASLKLTRKGTLIGTPTYMSLEQISCEPVDARSDIYSMGACLYEALTARPPYVGAHSLELIAQVGAGPPPDVRDVDRDVSPDLAHVVRVSMARERSARYQSAEAMREALRGAVTRDRPKRSGTRPITQIASDERTQVDAVAPSSDRAGRRHLPLVIGVAVVLGILGLSWLTLRSRAVPTSTVTPPAAVTTSVSVPLPAAIPAPVRAPPTTVTAALPRGLEPPPVTAIESRPVPTSGPPPRTRTPRPPHSRVGEDVLDPFAQ